MSHALGSAVVAGLVSARLLIDEELGLVAHDSARHVKDPIR